MKSSYYYQKQDLDKNTALIEKTKEKLEEFVEQNISSSEGCNARWSLGSSINPVVKQTVENELFKNGWKGSFNIVEQTGWSMTSKSESSWNEIWLEIKPTTKEESILIR